MAGLSTFSNIPMKECFFPKKKILRILQRIYLFTVSRQLVDLRIIAEAVGTSPSGRADIRKCGPPYVLLPEQAAVLVEYGKVQVKI